MYVIVTCKYEKNLRKSGNRVFPHYKSTGIFSDVKGQLTLQSLVGLRQIPELLQALMHVIFTCKYEKDWMKNSREKVATLFSPLWPYGSYLLPWKPVLKPICTNIKCNLSPAQMMLQIKFDFNSPSGLRYSCLKVWTDGHTSAQVS